MVILAGMAEKTSYQLAAEKLMAEGAVRVEAGETVILRPGFSLTILTGWAAWMEGTSRIICTGRVSQKTDLEITTPRGP